MCTQARDYLLQHDWKHGVPREARVFEPRINLTFRKLLR
jgi:hypothetical protein